MISLIYKRGRVWWWKYRPDGETGKPLCVSLGVSDKQVAERLQSDKVAELERERMGIIAPKEMREAAQQGFQDLIGDFVRDSRARGRAPKYVDNLQVRLKKLAAECGWKHLRDVTADSFVSWRTRQKMAAKTLNEYLNAASGLMNWLQRNGRVSANPLKVVGKVEMRGRETRQRRALTKDELQRLLASAGPRRVIYLFAAYTGLRRGELEQLEWADVHVDDAPEAFVEVRASTTKNHKMATIKLHTDVVSALRAFKAARGEAGGRVFRVPKIETFREDLKRAGIPYRDAQGKVADFHALRVTLCTNLQNAGVPQRVAQEIMRHSEGRLTEKVYTDAASLHTWSAIEKLPSVTDLKPLSHRLYQSLVAHGQPVSLPDTEVRVVDVEKPPVIIDESRAVSQTDTTGQDEKWRAQQELNLQPLVP